MNREEVIEQARAIGWVCEPCRDEDFIAVRAYEATDPNEKMRIGSSGEVYTNGDDGWMYQVGTVEDIANAVRARAKEAK